MTLFTIGHSTRALDEFVGYCRQTTSIWWPTCARRLDLVGCHISPGLPWPMLRLALHPFVAAVRSRRDLALENLVLRHQLQVALRTNPHPRLRAPDRVLWVWLRRLWAEGWQRHLRVVQPETVLRWHRDGWRLYWTWRSRTRVGRRRLSGELKALIGRISQENLLWGPDAFEENC